MLARLALRRGLCTAASAEAPAVMFGTAGRYANDLYAAAAKNKALDAVSADLTLLKGTLDSSPTLAAFCSDPSLSRTVKSKGIVDVLTAAKADDTTKKAMATLAEGGRLGDVGKVIDMYTELINAGKGEVTAVITSAEALAPAELQKITSQLDSFLVRRPPGFFFSFFHARQKGGRSGAPGSAHFGAPVARARRRRARPAPRRRASAPCARQQLRRCSLRRAGSHAPRAARASGSGRVPRGEPRKMCRAADAPLVPCGSCLRSQEGGQKKISLTTKVDSSLVSGITIEIGDKFLDYSVATQLKKLQSLLKDGI